MTRIQARMILGNQPKFALRLMAKALQMQAWSNSFTEWDRLRALRALGYKVTVSIPD